jgi:succinate dehydrogenase/fumarate reductase flavoprotein subunit
MTTTQTYAASAGSGQIDLLVIGSGMAGLSAAAIAAAAGASVVVVERDDVTGGSAKYAGYVWTAPDEEVLAEVDPHGDPELRRTFVREFAPALEWIRSLGVTCGPEVSLLRFGRGHRVDMHAILSACERLVTASGGEVLLGATTERLRCRPAEAGVDGAVVTLSDGSTRELRARHTLLATGGFQGDRSLTTEHIHPGAAAMPLRSNRTSSGAGSRLARSVGAAFGPENAGFYGHLVPADVELRDPYEFADLSLFYSEHALLFNLEGERFVDETVGDHLNTMAAVEQPGARVLVVADARVRDEWMSTSYVEGIEPIDKFALIRKRGARCVVADSLEDFDYMPAEWGYPGARVRAAIERFNADAADGRPVEPGRRYDPAPLDKPPYYVVDAVPAITFTFGGILIDEQARALDTEGTPIPGLLAAGADAGGLFVRAYAGGLAAALVFGRVAAATALSAMTARQGGLR